MTKKEHIDYWKSTSEKDWKAVQDLFRTKHYMHALFWSHLVLEKLCKAHWVKDNTANHPPKIHNLVVIIKATKMKLTEEQVACMALMNDFQLEGRYPDYKDKLYKRCNNAYTKHILEQANNLRLCLLKEVQ